MITIEGNQAVARFSSFDLSDYATFLKLKRTVPAPEMDLKYDWRKDTYTVRMPARYAGALGAAGDVYKAPEITLAPHLWDYERYFQRLALERKRYALFWDCGLGKTPMELEFCRNASILTGKKAMLCTFNSIIRSEFLPQRDQFYGDSLPIEVLETRKDIKLWCVGAGPGLAIMNTEKFMDKTEGLMPELRQLGCFALDESSILKTGGGTAKWNIIKSTKGIEYKLSGSATPAPNEAMEYASQASFLETITNDGEIIWTFFSKTKMGEWYIKPHAMEAFYRFLAGWSNYMRTPAAYGFKDNIRPVPEPEFIVHQVAATPEQMQEAQRYRFEIGAGLIGDQRLGVKERMKLSQIAKGFVYGNKKTAGNHSSTTGRRDLITGISLSNIQLLPVESDLHSCTAEKNGERRINQGHQLPVDSDDGRKRGYRSDQLIPSVKPGKVAELAAVEVVCNGCQVLVWTVFDEETNLIMRAFHGNSDETYTTYNVRALTGKTRDEDRENILRDFKRGAIDVLVSNARMLGFGQNLQMSGAMIISGWNDSFEQLYQLIRRSVRYGQTKVVRIHIPIVPELEQAQWDNLQRKQAAFDESARLQERYYKEAMHAAAITAGSCG